MAGMVADPVCEERVDPENAISTQYNGQTYYFCSQACKNAFEEEPEDFILKD